MSKTKAKPCEIKKHNFVEVYRAGEPGSQSIVKWCTICGAIVIEHEREDETSVMTPRIPKILNLL